MADTALQVVTPAPLRTPPGERYGRYHLLERIGKGGMAEIFRAVTTGGAEGWSRLFVIKRIRPEKSGSQEFIQMFCEEARLCAMLHHPNIVQVYDFGQIGGSYFLAMEYLRGKDLSSVMRALRAAKLAVPPAVAAFVAHQAASGLHHAHTLVDGNGQPVRIVHRDVTPSNIMLLRTGDVKILDFGIAKDTGQGQPEIVETDSGQVKGKLAYLSPEQVRCLALDARADVFALGVVLWEMLAGQRLFTADNEFQTMRNVLLQAVPPPSSVRPGIPAALDRIVARALDRDREQRYPTAQAMADELHQVVQSERLGSQAIPQLLEQLFGDEPSTLTPQPIDPMAGIPVARTSTRRGVGQSSAIPLGLVPTGAEVSIQIIADPEVLPSRSWIHRAAASPRNIVASTAAATLAVCLSWAAWKGTRRPEPLAAAPVAASAPTTIVAPAPPPAIAPAPTVVTAPADAMKAAPTHARTLTSARAKSIPRRPHRPLATDLTLNPFR